MVSQGKTGLQEVAPGIWADILDVGPQGGGPNAGFILAGDKTIVIDALISLSAARELRAAIKKAGGKEPSFLINTHGDADHIIGNQIFSPPAVIIAQENTREAIMNDGAAGFQRMAQFHPELAGELREAVVVAPQITFCDALSLYFEGRSVHLIHPGPAHTLGDALVYIPEEQVLFTGDLLFNQIVPPIRGDSANWVRTLAWLEEQDIKVVIPGHGYAGTKDNLTEMKKFLQRLRREVKKCYQKGVPQDKAASEINLGRFESWAGKERLAMSIPQLYKELSGA
jgi:cyclase